MVVLPSEDGVMDSKFSIYDLRLTTSVEVGTSRCDVRAACSGATTSIPRDVSVRPYLRVCAAWKRLKRRVPSARVETTSNTYLPVGEGQGEGNRIAAHTATRKATSNLSSPSTEPRDSSALV